MLVKVKMDPVVIHLLLFFKNFSPEANKTNQCDKQKWNYINEEDRKLRISARHAL